MSAKKTVSMSANQHAALFFAKAIEMAEKSPNKKVNLQDVFATLPKPKQQTFVRNGITIEFPVGWRSIQDFKGHLEYNLKCTDRVSKMYHARDAAKLALINAALA